MTIKAVLWDMDGTLVDSEPIAVGALAVAMREAGLPVPDDLFPRVVGRSADDLYGWLARDLGLRMDPLDWEARKHHHYFADLADLKGFPEALRAWEAVDRRGLAQAVVSNSDRAIMDVNLRTIGIVRPGLVTVSRNDVREGKPHPEGYLRAAWLLCCDPAEVLVVEDSASGAAAARAAGMRTVFVPHAAIPAPPETVPLRNFEELLALLG